MEKFLGKSHFGQEIFPVTGNISLFYVLFLNSNFDFQDAKRFHPPNDVLWQHHSFFPIC